MDNQFIVSARKYRPQNFATVVGQEHITTTLKNAIKHQQLAHAFLFCGPRGVGKTTCARILAKTINCTNQTPEGEACNQCNSCVSFDAGTSMNIHELDAASNNGVDEIRALVDQVRFAPQAGKYKVYIVDEVHMLSSSAFNAFLKTLEEPPAHAIFILATTEKHKILPTILSRCQIFDFKRITNNDTVNHLIEIVNKESIKAEKAALQVIAQKSEGCMRDSLSILDKIVSFTNGEVTYLNTLEHLNILDEDYYFQLLEALQKQDLAESMLLFDQINRKGFEGDMVMNGFAEFIRNLLVAKDERSAVLLEVLEGMQEKYFIAAKKCSSAYLISSLNILNEAEVNYKMARNKRLHVELALIKLNFLPQALELAVENGQILKKKRLDGPIAISKQTIKAFQSKELVNKQAEFNPPQEQAIVQQQPGVVPSPAKLLVDEKKISSPITASSSPIPSAKIPQLTSTDASKPKKNLLDTLRNKYGKDYQIEEVKEALPLEFEKLQNCWNAYTAKLAEQKKHSTYGTFQLAQLAIENDRLFSITVPSLISQKFVEQEKANLLDFIQSSFHNRSIFFEVLVEASEREDIPLHLRLNSKQKFEYLAEQYPLLKELKETLRLDIEI